MSDVILRADGGEITVGRQIGSFVWGRWDVTLPSDVSLKDQPDTRMAEGFLYKPEDLPKGRFDLRGVRADSSQTMVAKKSGEIDYALSTSDTEQVLDAAEKRIEGNLFFEKDITTDGLGIYEPGVDFHEDDLVDVMLWGKRLPDLPVTAIDIAAERGSAERWRVHVGGQPIADAAALRSSREKIFAQIAAERREAASKLGVVSQQAVSAGKAAAKADTKAAVAQETADDALAKWRQQKDQLDTFQTRQINELAAQNEALRRVSQLQQPISGTISTYDPLILGPVTVKYPKRNQISFELTDTEHLSGVSVIMNARVDALAQYSYSVTATLTPAQRDFVGSVGWAENYVSASILVIPTADFSAILTEERRKRGLY